MSTCLIYFVDFLPNFKINEAVTHTNTSNQTVKKNDCHFDNGERKAEKYDESKINRLNVEQ